jgi:hypothetical protein
MNDDIKCLVRSGLFLAIAVVFQMIGRIAPPEVSQYLVGSVVNSVLLIATYLCGIWWGAAVGILTPLTAWVMGQLNPFMAPFIPFIMVGNIIIIVTFGILKHYKVWGKYAGFIIGAVLKYGFLYISASKLIQVFKLDFEPKIVSKLVIAMGLPQLFTGLLGGAVAVTIIAILLKRKIIREAD